MCAGKDGKLVRTKNHNGHTGPSCTDIGEEHMFILLQ